MTPLQDGCEKEREPELVASGLIFGIYPLGVAGTPVGLAVGPKDDDEKIRRLLEDLKGPSKVLLPRNYIVYTGPGSENKLLAVAERYANAGLLGDLAIGCFQDADLPLDGWIEFIRTVLRKYGSRLDALQITNEPNLTFMDGSKPYVLQALVQGVLAAKQEALLHGFRTKIGFGSVPEGPKTIPHFWENLAQQGGARWIESVDYVGHNFYVDVFEDEPIPLEKIPDVVESTLRHLREQSLTKAGIPASVPIRITENGWPTGKNPFAQVQRTYDRQAEVLEIVIRTVHRLRNELNITHYELFGLRDADSSKDDLFHQFGIVRDDYTPKPAYDTFKRLVRELGN
jgi:hypothetical protein